MQDELFKKFHPKVRLLHTLAIMNFNSNKNNSFETQEFINYKCKIQKISKKITKWYQTMTETKK